MRAIMGGGKGPKKGGEKDWRSNPNKAKKGDCLGKANPIFAFIDIMATTEPIETDEDRWGLRLYLIRN